MTTKHAACIAFVLAAFTAPLAKAQHLEQPKGRQGYWVSVGITQGATAVREEGDNKGIYATGGLNIRLGELLTERFGMGLFVDYNGIVKQKKEGGVYTKDDKGVAGGLGVELNYCPWRALGLRSGFGFGVSMLTDDATEDKALRGGYGKYLVLGASYEFFPWRNRLTGGWAITPSLDFRAMPDGNVHTFSGFATVAVTWWSGLDKHMLVLPEDQQ